ncbi:hypothetical protein EHS39_23545 [Ensifer sp. MPMI2T]|nr:hypothetical protein EHS39_23545 [Ensifer sp. MPMI2T]
MTAPPIEAVAQVVRKTLLADFAGVGSNHGRKLKAVVSAGALHPIQSVIVSGACDPVIYDDDSDQFFSVQVRDDVRLQAFVENCRTVLPDAGGCWVALIADCRDLSSLYTDHQSLLWRDAGAVIQMMALVAEAHGLAFCPLGILGTEIVEALLTNHHHHHAVAVGVMAIGKGEAA